MEVIKALKDIKEYCKGVSVKDCNSRKCEIWRILGDCIFFNKSRMLGIG